MVEPVPYKPTILLALDISTKNIGLAQFVIVANTVVCIDLQLIQPNGPHTDYHSNRAVLDLLIDYIKLNNGTDITAEEPLLQAGKFSSVKTISALYAFNLLIRQVIFEETDIKTKLLNVNTARAFVRKKWGLSGRLKKDDIPNLLLKHEFIDVENNNDVADATVIGFAAADILNKNAV
jgi:hypothetical protein